MSKKDKGVTPEEKELFRQHVKSLSSQQAGANNIEAEPEPVSFEPRFNDASDIGPDTIIHYFHPSMNPNTQRKLKRGTINLEARLDLHGYTVDEATTAISRWVAHHQARGHKNGIIIHGKGGKLSETSILKQLTSQLLQAHPSVLAYHSAQPKHGGTGAVYVVLKC